MSKHTTIKGNCVVKQRESLFCAGLLWECSCSSSSLQHGSTALFSSFIFQFGRPQSVTCQQHLYYIGEARRKKTCLEVFPYQQTSQCGLCSQKYVEISQVFLSAAFLLPSPASCLQMGAASGWGDLPVPQMPAGITAQSRAWDRVPIPGSAHKPSRCGLWG